MRRWAIRDPVARLQNALSDPGRIRSTAAPIGIRQLSITAATAAARSAKSSAWLA